MTSSSNVTLLQLLGNIAGMTMLFFAVWYFLMTVRDRFKDYGFQFGFVFRPGSLWVGAHWSSYNKRLCVNLIPMFTIKITAPGGTHVSPGAKN